MRYPHLFLHILHLRLCLCLNCLSVSLNQQRKVKYFVSRWSLFIPAFVNSTFLKAMSVQRMLSVVVFKAIKSRNQGIYAIINSNILIYMCPVRRYFKIFISNKHAKRSYYCNIMCNKSDFLWMPLQYELMHWLLFRINNLINVQQSNRDI